MEFNLHHSFIDVFGKAWKRQELLPLPVVHNCCGFDSPCTERKKEEKNFYLSYQIFLKIHQKTHMSKQFSILITTSLSFKKMK